MTPRSRIGALGLTILCLAASCASPGSTEVEPVPPAATATVVPADEVLALRPLAPPDGRVHLLVFVTTDCPIANGYAPEVQAIAADYAPRGVRTFLVQVDPEVTPELARAHAADFGYTVEVLLDPKHELVGATAAEVTPEAVVVLPDTPAGGPYAYQGRIDDWYEDLGRKRRFPRNHDLRAALDAVLAGRPVEVPRTRAIGCLVPDPL